MLDNIRNRIYRKRKQWRHDLDYYTPKLHDILDGLINPVLDVFAPTRYNKVKVAICLICKDENEYLGEWLEYHRSLGFNHFFIYDNNSQIPISKTLAEATDCTITLWHDDTVGKQLRAYYDCCLKNTNYDWILFIDTDEFLILKKNKTVQQFLKAYKNFKAVGLNWICYTSSGHENRVKWDKYNKHLPLDTWENRHIKSFVKPQYIKSVPADPHKFPVITVNEHKQLINGPILTAHSSDIAYIRHNITRSRNEYVKKITRGRGDGMPSDHSMNTFNTFEKQSI